MWQRVQTLYIGLATLILVALYWCDAARIALADGEVEHIRYIDKTIYLVWLIILTVFQVLSLGGYKWRMRQLRVVIVTAIMCLGFQAWLVVDYFRMPEQMVMSWTALFPLAAAVLDFIGARNIMLDEAIVQSANRLRAPRKNRNKRK